MRHHAQRNATRLLRRPRFLTALAGFACAMSLAAAAASISTAATGKKALPPADRPSSACTRGSGGTSEVQSTTSAYKSLRVGLAPRGSPVQSSVPMASVSERRTGIGRRAPRLVFVRNVGQWSPKVLYAASTAGATVWLTRNGLVFDVLRKHTTRERRWSVTERLSYAQVFKGRSRHVAAVGGKKVSAVYRYVRRRRAYTTSAFGELTYRNVWPGIDVRLYAKNSGLEEELTLAPGSDSTQIRFAYLGARGIAVDDANRLVIHTVWGERHASAPVAYQAPDGDRSPRRIPSAFDVGSGYYAFSLGRYDHSRAVVIDPTLDYATYLGGSGIDQASAVAIDAQGEATVVGATTSVDFPTRFGVQTTLAGRTDAYVTRLNASGSDVLYSTYLGGAEHDLAQGVSVGPDGSAYVTGSTNSTNFPTTPGAFQPSGRDGTSVFTTKLSPRGAVVYSTLLHGSSFDGNLQEQAIGGGIAVDGSGDAFVVGLTGSADFPHSNAPQSTLAGNVDGFLTELNPAGSGIIYSTFIGGAAGDGASAVAIDANGNAYVTGYTFSSNLPVTAGALDTALRGPTDAWVAKVPPVDPTNPHFAYLTYLGGGAGGVGFEDNGYGGGGIAVDASGNAYVTGQTDSANFPTTPGVYQSTLPGAQAVFVSKLNPSGGALIYSTFIGERDGAGNAGLAIRVDGSGRAVVAGTTGSLLFPTTPDAVRRNFTGNVSADAFLLRLSADASILDYSTYFGGGEASGLALDRDGNAYLAGQALDRTLPVTSSAFQSVPRSTGTGFVAKIFFVAPQTLAIDSIVPNIAGNAGTVTTQIFGHDFVPGASVLLRHPGAPDITASRVVVADDGRSATAVFPMDGVPTGVWDVVLTGPAGHTATLAAGFSVTSPVLPDASNMSISIIGFDAIRPGVAQNYYVAVANNGNVDARGVPVLISFSDSLQYELRNAVVNPTVPSSDPIDFSRIPLAFNADGMTELPLILPVVPPRATILVGLTLTASQTALTRALRTHSGIATSLLTLAGEFFAPLSEPNSVEKWSGCLATATSLLGFVPGLGCATGIAAFALDAFSDRAVPVESGSFYVVFSLSKLWLGAVTALTRCLVPGSGALVEIYEHVGNAMKGIDIGRNCFSLITAKVFKFEPHVAVDPNEKAGPQGIGLNRLVSSHQPFTYDIRFENLPTATAPVERVVVTDQLDTTSLDASSAALGPVILDQFQVIPPVGSKDFQVVADLRPGNNLLVAAHGHIDAATGLLTWTLQALDPATNQPPTDPLAGFILPDINPPAGEGSLLLTVQPKSGLDDGTVISNRATIVFDNNSPLTTNNWTNTMDNTAPTSAVTTLPLVERTTSFPISWSGDDTSGIAGYDVYVSKDEGARVLLKSFTTDTSTTFVGTPGARYAFYSVAHDGAGNVEAPPSSPDAVTIVDLPPSFLTGVADARLGQYSDAIAPFTITARDLDDEPGTLSFTAAGLPRGLDLVDNHDGSATVTGTVDAVPAVYTPQYTVSDSNGPTTVQGGAIAVTKEETTTGYTGASGSLMNGSIATLAGVLRQDGSTPISDRPLTLTLGDGPSSQSCTGTTDAAGLASCAITISQPTGPGTVGATFAGDAFYEGSSDSRLTLILGTCGVERWSVKTLQDRPHLLAARITTVARLVRLRRPTYLPDARLPFERHIFIVVAAVTLVRQEADEDLHVVLVSGRSHMIAEAPNAPACTPRATAIRRKQMARARTRVRVCAKARVTGVVFWDFKHRQTGVAPNAIELHPILGFACLSR